MEYRKIIKLLDNTLNRPSFLEQKIGLEFCSKTLNFDFKTLKIKTTISMSSLCDYNDAYIFVKGTVTVVGVRAVKAA